ncbi:MAG: lipid II:glycine glycyltransferase FemX [Candidatus Levyibacteriota bacterium]
MAKITTKEITEKKTWEKALSQFSEANFLQSWEWGEFHQRIGKEVIKTGFFENGKQVGAMLSVVEKARRGTYLTVPGGPIINWSHPTIVRIFYQEIKRIGKEHGCSFVRVRPQLESTDFSKKLFKKLGFKTSPMHLHAELTNQLDISKTEEELLAHMRKATRYEIKKAQKLGVRVEESMNSKAIQKFYNLQLETARRQKFIPFSYVFLKEQFDVFAKEGKAILYSSFMDRKLLAQAFIIFYGNEAVYHYGASTEDGRKFPGAYLIQWHAILEAKKRGIKTYNFWGVANDPGHRFASLSLFKRGFGGEDFAYLHAHDLVLKPLPYTLNFLIETIRKKIRRV